MRIALTGERNVLAFRVDEPENEQAWKDLFDDLKGSGVREIGSLDQPGAELTEDEKIKAEILQFQAQRVFPIDPGPNRFCRLPIGQLFHKLQHGHRDQPPRRLGWLSPAWKESSEQLILKDRAQFIADPEAQTILGADSACQASCLFGNGGNSSSLRDIFASFTGCEPTGSA